MASVSAVADLESGLQAMLSLKPPGVTGSRIQSITALCKANVESESVLIQKLYTHFKKAPGTHKLGVLYVVDSVTREWVVLAKAAGQTINSAASDGTYAAGVNRVKELLPVLMNDIIQSAPHDQKEKIKKLVDIWEKGQTFPLQMLVSFKEKLGTSMQNRSTTPDGSPPPDLQIRLGLQQPNRATPPAPAVMPQNTSSILEALANMARQNTSAPLVVPNITSQVSPENVSNAQNNAVQHPGGLNQPLAYSQYPTPVNTNYGSPMQHDGAQQPPSSQATPWLPAPNLIAPPAVGLDPATAMLVKMLAERGVNAEHLAGIIGRNNDISATAPTPAPPMFPFQNGSQNDVQNGREMRHDETRDRNGYHDRDPMRSPRYRRRSRSPSPSRTWNARDSPTSRRREEPGYDFGRGRDSPGRSRGEDRGGRGRGNEYRQRSPPRRGRSPSPPRNRENHNSGQKWIEYDSTIPRGSIKVLSRTLFVGGVNSSEPELRKVFSRFGTVQTCIVNKEKRHAFVKMISRTDAVTAREAMEENKPQDSSRGKSFNQTRWGVGFGPRDCSDYTTGISVIPISKLTDADRKWITTAEYGGTGGKPIESGMVVEEPDIEIGQGVSSKAISRRMQTDKGGEKGGSKFGRDREDHEGSRNRRGQDRDGGRGNRRSDDWKDKSNDAPPVMPPFTMPGFPGFPGGIPGYPMPTMPNGMAMFPNFPFSGLGQNGQSQPPPPGRD